MMTAMIVLSLLFCGLFLRADALLSFRPGKIVPSPIEIWGGSTVLPDSAAKARASQMPKVISSSEPQCLPWDQSITPSRDLTYMPLFESTLAKIRSMPGMKEIPLESKFVHHASTVKPARIGNMAFQNEQFRKIRLTYFDAGDAVQVFNACFYPSFGYDLPMLGVDLISLGKGRVLSVVDFQPLHPTAEYAEKYIADLTTIREQYPDLHGTLSGKIYDDTSFFSKNMLFGRFTDESKIPTVVAPALAKYVEHYFDTMKSATPNLDPAAMKIVEQRQAAYDAYSALKDPAVGLFDAYFGKEWSASFVHDYLFSLSDAKVTAKKHALSKAANTQEASKGKQVHKFTINSTTGEVSPIMPRKGQ